VRKIVTISLVSLFAVGIISADDNKITSEAEFILDLFNKIEWPESTTDSAPFVISIIGETPLAEQLTALANDKTINGHAVEIQSVGIGDDLSKSMIVFIGSSELGDLAKVLKRVDGKKILTVSSNENFARYGVMINFVQDEGESKLGYELNKLSLKMAGLKADPELIENARLI
jgi:hypothetical protein